jgi:hypothetical protein
VIPQLVVLDGVGHHNSDLSGARDRLKTTGAYKPQRIALVLPAIRKLEPKVALMQWNLLFPQNQRMVRVLALGEEVGVAYSEAISQLLGHFEYGQYEYVLTIEADNMPPADGVLRLLADLEAHPEFCAIGGLYFTKGEQGVAQLWGDPADPAFNVRPQLPIPGQLVECCAVPMGFTLWRMPLFRDPLLPASLFLSETSLQGVTSPDVFFWRNARVLGYRCAIDCNVKVGHFESADESVDGEDHVWYGD